ncbi:MAG TPA: hypothetical protein VGM03_23940, partial [Phycisphaerae bacterium]
SVHGMLFTSGARRLQTPDVPQHVLAQGVEAVKRWMAEQRDLQFMAPTYLMVRFEADGSFRIEDVPAGRYKLSAQSFGLGGGGDLDNVEHEFDVPEMPSGRSDEPLSIGSIEMKAPTQPKRFRPPSISPVRIDTQLELVEKFERANAFYALDSSLWQLDTRTSGKPRRLNQVWRDGTQGGTQIAPLPDGTGVAISDGEKVLVVSLAGEVTELAALERMRAIPDEPFLATGRISGGMAFSDDGRFLFLNVTGVLGKENYFGRLNFDIQELQIGKGWFAAGAEINRANGVVYSPFSCKSEGDGLRIDAFDLDEALSRTYAVSRKYHRCQLSSDRTRLLLSTSDTEEKPAIALLQLDDGKESALPISGSYASWTGPDAIVFIRSSRELWSYRLGDERPVRLMSVDGEPPDSQSIMNMKASWALPPVCSADGSWVCWQYTIKSPQGFSRNGTVLIDLTTRQCRRLDDLWWHTVAWGH